VASTPKAISTHPAGAAIPTALTEFINKSQEDIELFDLVQIYRNEQILANSQTRDQELVMQLREQRLENRSLVFDQLRDLNARQPIQPDLPELPSSLKDEIKSLSDELGKRLSA
jgi:predicted ATPase